MRSKLWGLVLQESFRNEKHLSRAGRARGSVYTCSSKVRSSKCRSIARLHDAFAYLLHDSPVGGAAVSDPSRPAAALPSAMVFETTHRLAAAFGGAALNEHHLAATTSWFHSLWLWELQLADIQLSRPNSPLFRSSLDRHDEAMSHGSVQLLLLRYSWSRFPSPLLLLAAAAILLHAHRHACTSYSSLQPLLKTTPVITKHQCGPILPWIVAPQLRISGSFCAIHTRYRSILLIIVQQAHDLELIKSFKQDCMIHPATSCTS